MTPRSALPLPRYVIRKPLKGGWCFDRLFSFKTMFAYTGHYRVEGDRLTTKVDVAWNEAWRGTDQVRFFRLQDDKLFIESAPLPSLNYPEMGQVRGILEWERSK
jgi:Lipocalin-like domain